MSSNQSGSWRTTRWNDAAGPPGSASFSPPLQSSSASTAPSHPLQHPSFGTRPARLDLATLLPRPTAAGPSGSAASSAGSSTTVSAAGPSGSAAPPSSQTRPSESSSSSRDDRVYSTPRVRCDASYDLRPGMILGAKFELPHIFRYHGREIKFGKEWYEAWSPNSLQRPYLPGRRKLGFGSQIFPSKPEQRRFDGLPGRFDPLEAPQYVVHGREWLPFARRPSTVRPKESCMVGFRSVAVEWSKGRSDGNRVNAPFIEALRLWHQELCAQSKGLRTFMLEDEWVMRPMITTEQEFEVLEGLRLFEDAVDLVARIQWHLRERQAWITMCCTFLGLAGSKDIWAPPYGAANDELIGVWINGASEDKAGWYLQAKVPVFFVHRYAPGKMRRSERESIPVLADFAEGTEAFARKSADENGCANLARRWNAEETWQEEDDGREPADLPPTEEHHARLSSSLFLESRQQARTDKVELPALPPQRPEDPRYIQPPLFRYELFPGRVAWIEPPMIEAPASSGKWEKWELSSEVDFNDGEEAVFKRAKSWRQEESEGTVWYDRVTRREIYVYEDYQPPIGVLHSWTFGCPVPRCRYFEGKKLSTPSHWMYRDRSPQARDVGRYCEFPGAEDLPFAKDSSVAALSDLDNVSGAPPRIKLEIEALPPPPSPPKPASPLLPPTSSLAPRPSEIQHEEIITSMPLPEPLALEVLRTSPQPTGKGKGKSRVVSDDEVSLGSELEDKDLEAFGGRSAVEEFLAGAIEPNPPSAFLRLRHVPGSPSSFAFVERFTRLLRARGVNMESVLNAQHAVWVCFADAQAGEQGMAVLAKELGGEGAELSFESAASFNDTQLFGTDVWYTALTEKSDSADAVPIIVDEPAPAAVRAPPTALRAMIQAPQPEYKHWSPYEPAMPRVKPPTQRRRDSRSLSPKARSTSQGRRPSPPVAGPSKKKGPPSIPPRRFSPPIPPPHSSPPRSPSPMDEDAPPDPPRGGGRVSVHTPALYSRLYHPPRPLTPFDERIARSEPQDTGSGQWTNPYASDEARMTQTSSPASSLLERLTAPRPSLGQRLTNPSSSVEDRMTSTSSQAGGLLRRANVQLEERLRDRGHRRVRRKKRGRRAGKHNRLRRDSDSDDDSDSDSD
ncbi:hypothetical protein DFH06DRAFT_1326954 [Mycena polygramma]|nr:hypothetical protein DFH06DRAFT_1326954 [Mycena polygramma]